MKGSVSNPYPGMMKESVSAYRIYGDGTDHEGDIWKSFRGKKQGEYTLKEYEAIPDEYRVELIDGVIYDLNMPTTIHQQLVFEISIKLREYIRQNKGLCMVLPSPVSVQLDEDDRTMLMTPGATQLTVMPLGPSSFASALVRPMSPAFAAE